MEIISLKIKDLLQASENYSLVKVDIEGAEQYIIDDLSIFSTCNAAVWLSLHPPFIANKYLFLQQLLDLQKYFYFTDSNNCKISSEKLSLQFLSDVEKPNWGTVWGNVLRLDCYQKDFLISPVRENKIIFVRRIRLNFIAFFVLCLMAAWASKQIQWP